MDILVAATAQASVGQIMIVEADHWGKQVSCVIHKWPDYP